MAPIPQWPLHPIGAPDATYTPTGHSVATLPASPKCTPDIPIPPDSFQSPDTPYEPPYATYTPAGPSVSTLPASPPMHPWYPTPPDGTQSPW